MIMIESSVGACPYAILFQSTVYTVDLMIEGHSVIEFLLVKPQNPSVPNVHFIMRSKNNTVPIQYG
jgi:hypothetical protein